MSARLPDDLIIDRAPAVAAAKARYEKDVIGTYLTAICRQHSPMAPRAAFDEALADIKPSMASGEFTPHEWMICLRSCVQ